MVGDADSTWAGYVLPTGSNALGRRFVAGIRRGLSASAALDAAKLEYARTFDGPRHAALLASVGLTGDGTAKVEAA